MRANQNIRNAAKRQGVKLWQIAAYLGVSEATITRWMRIPLPAEREALLLSAITEVAKEAS